MTFPSNSYVINSTEISYSLQSVVGVADHDDDVLSTVTSQQLSL